MKEPGGYSIAWLIAAAVAFVADLFLHLPVTDGFDFIAKRFGFFTYDRITKYVFLAIALLCLAAAWRWAHRRIAVAVTMLMALAGIAQALLLVAGIENIHYPQYALLAYLLARGLPNTEAAWLGATGLGLLDEAYQFLVLPRGTPEYLDWNDILLNAIGAAFGLVIVAALHRGRGEVLKRNIAVALAVVALVLALLLGAPQAPFFRETPGGRSFHLLSAFEAIVVLSLLWWGVRALLSDVRHQSGR